MTETVRSCNWTRSVRQGSLRICPSPGRASVRRLKGEWRTRMVSLSPNGCAMSRFSYVLIATSLAVGLPADAQQWTRTIEFGFTGGVAHHDFHYRYPGEGRWQDPLGVRLDARFRTSPLNAMGVALVADRYAYSVSAGYCVSDCATIRSTGAPNILWFSTPWQVSRLGLGATWQRQVWGPLHGSVGLLAGRSWRQTVDDVPTSGPLPVTTREWFAGTEAAFTVHLRDLLIGVGGEYGRVPRTEYALRPYYGRITGRVGYRAAW